VLNETNYKLLDWVLMQSNNHLNLNKIVIDYAGEWQGSNGNDYALQVNSNVFINAARSLALSLIVVLRIDVKVIVL